jgi:hypothetical protein
MRVSRSGRIALTAALTLVLVLAVAALAGAKPPPGKGKPANPGKSATAAKKQYSPSGKQYGKHRVTICHKGHTIKVAPPAVKAHLRHGDHLGPC